MALPVVNNTPKHQHFVPCSFLTRFAINEQGRSTRDRRIWVFDDVRCRESTVEREGYANNIYGVGQDAVRAEETFQAFENEYVRIMAILDSHRGPRLALSPKDEFSLFFFALHLYLRNRSVEVDGISDRMQANQDAFWTLLGDLLSMPQTIADPRTGAQRLSQYQTLWEANLFETGSRGLIVSDNPVVLWAHGDVTAMIYLPLDKVTFIVFHQRTILRKTSVPVSDNDVRRLHGACYGQRLRFSYADHPFDGYITGDLTASLPDELRPSISPSKLGLSRAIISRPFDFMGFHQ